jgi:SCP-2 sterol transfer family protein
MWKIHQRINRDLLPERRTVVEFDFTGPRPHRAWLVLQRSEVSVCVTPPGFDPDLVVRADLAFFYRLWLGYVEYDVALRSGSVVLEGATALAREFPRWLMWSPMSRFVRQHIGATASDPIAQQPNGPSPDRRSA